MVSSSGMSLSFPHPIISHTSYVLMLLDPNVGRTGCQRCKSSLNQQAPRMSD
jgi:hypothetical protein